MTGLLGMGLGLAAQYAAKPKDIDPNTVYELGTSPYNEEMYNRSNDLLDYDSELNRKQFNKMNEAVQDNTYTANRINARNNAAQGFGNQSGILNQQFQQTSKDNNAQLLDSYNNYMSSNMDKSNNLLTNATTNDMKARDNMVSAYGTNITNKNNWGAAMAGNVTKTIGDTGDAAKDVMGIIAGFSDKTMKKNIKKIGKAKAKDGKMVNLYKFQFKGSDKTETGVIAQEIKKSHPNCVTTGENGKLKVLYGELF